MMAQDDSLISDCWRSSTLQPWTIEKPPLHWRIALLIFILVMHAIAVRWIADQMAPRPQQYRDQPLLVLDFTDDIMKPRSKPARRVKLDAKVPRRAETAQVDATESRKPIPTSAQAQVTSPARRDVGPAATTPNKPTLLLHNPDGSLRLPDDLLDQIDKKYGDKRVFSYQIPRLGDAEKQFYRNDVIAYEATRFDEYWKPDKDLLTDVLEKLVEKTTKEIRIPVPGRPGSTIICKVSLLALGGACGVMTNGRNYVGPVDDPSTLSPEEDEQCRAWWEQITSATTQAVWRKTRQLYEAECRKPLEPLQEKTI